MADRSCSACDRAHSGIFHQPPAKGIRRTLTGTCEPELRDDDGGGRFRIRRSAAVRRDAGADRAYRTSCKTRLVWDPGRRRECVAQPLVGAGRPVLQHHHILGNRQKSATRCRACERLRQSVCGVPPNAGHEVYSRRAHRLDHRSPRCRISSTPLRTLVRMRPRSTRASELCLSASRTSKNCSPCKPVARRSPNRRPTPPRPSQTLSATSSLAAYSGSRSGSRSRSFSRPSIPGFERPMKSLTSLGSPCSRGCRPHPKH